MPNSSLATLEEDGGVIISRVQVLSPVGAREVTVVPAAKNQTKPNQASFQYRYRHSGIARAEALVAATISSQLLH